jgi:hypothetical protein
MTFDSVYEMTTPLKEVRKQHFWEYFSGKTLDRERWTELSGTGTGSGSATTTYAVMDSSVDGGLKISSHTGTWGKASISFNGKNQFDATASEMILVQKRTYSPAYTINGFNSTSIGWDSPYHESGIKNYSADSYFKLITSDGSQQSETDSSVANDTNWHVFKIKNTNVNNQLTVDGTLALTKTNDRPTNNMQPQLMAMTYYAEQASANNHVRYVEAYNT